MIDVNLLPEQKLSQRQDVKVKTYGIVTIVLVVLLTALILGGVFGFRTYQETELSKLQEKKEFDASELNSLSDVATDLLTLKKKAKGVVTIEENTYDFESAFEHVSSLLPPGIALNKVMIKDNGEIVLTLSSGNAQEVADYISQTSEDGEVKDALLSGLNLADDQKINFVLDSSYGKPKKVNQLD